ncbi:MAG: preprotein translocase subunit SecG [Novosphingobium sp.]|nr:preprotein translocase subunit SecG [Novosphingobium sp.]MDP3906023.1 preprotein translocase subunit SecG [Novosphingobium sp.]
MFIFLTVVQAIVAALLVAIILMQKSEGGGLGVGGSPTGLMSARGAADFLTRSTAVLAVLFVVLSIVLAVLAVGTTTSRELDTSLERGIAPVAPAPVDPLGAAAQPAPGGALAPAPAPASTAPVDPLGSATKQ